MNGTHEQATSESDELRIDALARAVQGLDARVQSLERRLARDGTSTLQSVAGSVADATMPARPATQGLSAPPKEPSEQRIEASLVRAGQACLILCGAFLLRAITERGALPVGIGLALGLVYALVWLGVSGRRARRGHRRDANFFGVASAIVAFPIVWESATRFDVIGGEGAALLVGVVALPALALAWKRDLAPVAWTFASLASIVCIALMFALHVVEPLAAPLLAVGAATAWIAYERDWPGLHWLTAFAVDAYVLHMTVLAGASSEKLQWTRSAVAVIALSLALFVVYVSVVVVQTRRKAREIDGFAIAQTALALLIGIGGACRVARVAGTGVTSIAVGTLVAGLASYAAAFAESGQRWTRRRNFMYHSWLAFSLLLAGSYFIGEGPAIVGAWSTAGVVAVLLGTRFGRLTLHYHGAAYLLAAAYSSGLVWTALRLFTLPVDVAWPTLGGLAIVVLVASACAYAVLAFTPIDPDRRTSSRIPRLVLAFVTVVGIGGFAIDLGGRVLVAEPRAEAAALVAAARTIVLAASATVLAASARSVGARELRWLAYAVLLVGALKLLVEDLRVSNPGALFVEFGVFGLSLLVSQRLLRTRRAPEDPTTNSTG